MLEVTGLCAETALHQPILTDLNFSVAPGRCLCIIGESGAGKTSTLLSLLGLFDGTLSGQVRLDGKNLLTLPEKALCEIRGKAIGMVFQNPRLCLNPVRKVGRQIEDALAVHQKLPRKVRTQQALELLDRVALSNPETVYHAYPHMLSGGMGQRVGVAIAIACNPQIVLADEPTSALDPTLHKQVIALFCSLKAQGTSLIVATHQKKVVEALADEIAVMRQGRMVELAPAASILTAPQHPYTRALVADF